MNNKKRKTVLIIEDSPTQALSLRSLLEDEGLNVLHAPSGRFGVEIAHDQLPDAIVLDIEMPGMNGYEVSVQLSNEPDTSHIPIIMLTRHDSLNMAQKGMILGAIDFIPKDVFADIVLLETLRQLDIVDSTNHAIQ